MDPRHTTRAGGANRRRFIVGAICGGTSFAAARAAPARAGALDGISGSGTDEDRLAIFQVLQDYLRVTDERDEAGIGKAFHPLAALMSVTAAGDVVALTQAAWWARVSRIPAGGVRRRSVVRIIDAAGRAAIARVDISSGANESTDYFNLLRTGDGWKIVNKVLSSPLG